MKILLFVSSHCPHCPRAERVVRKVAPGYYDYGLTFKKMRTKGEEGRELSSRYNIAATPSILLFGDDNNEIKRIVGVPSEENLRTEIEKVLGLRKSFWSRIFGGKHESR